MFRWLNGCTNKNSIVGDQQVIVRLNRWLVLVTGDEVRDLSEWLYRWLVTTAVASITATSTSDAGGPGVAVASVVAVVRVAVRSVGGERVLSCKNNTVNQVTDHVQ